MPSQERTVPPADLEAVLAAEGAAIVEARQALGMSAEESRQAPLWGLALSGGGIRSATFNLGVLQALARLRLLARFDYLSTVSGGGYIGGWLVALCHRLSPIRDLAGTLDDPAALAERTGDRDPVTWLRDYSNYLTPHKGLLSGDTWAAVATYLRNLILNQLALLFFLGLVLLLPRWLYLFSHTLIGFPRSCLTAALVLSAGALVFVAGNLAVFDKGTQPRWNSPRFILWFITLPLHTAAWLLICSFYNPARDFGDLPFWRYGTLAAALYFLGWVLAALLDRGGPDPSDVRRDRGRSWPVILLSSIPAGFLGGSWIWAVHLLLVRLDASLAPFHLLDGVPSPSLGIAEDAVALWVAIAVGTPLVVVGLTVTAVFHLGLIGRSLADWVREWWARLGGTLLICSFFFWCPLLLALLFGPLLLARAHPLLSSFLTSGWLLTTAGGILAGKSPQTGSPGASRRLEALAKPAAYVFLAGLTILLAIGLGAALELLTGELGAPPFLLELAQSATRSWGRNALFLAATSSGPVLAVATAALAAALLLLAWRLDINEFSMNPLYRNRLVRGYLGASNPRRSPESFTGFDPGDDVALADLMAGEEPIRPYPLFNAALNHVKGSRIAWRERKALPFLLSPLFCGYDIGLRGRLPEPGEPQDGYRPTDEYASDPQKLTLGTALAISGAAVNPCMGYHSSPAVTFLLTLFNARLGWWLPNPRVGSGWRTSGPDWGLRYLLTELFGRTDFSRPHIHLSDGGHAENLGLYQLVKRRCPFIVVSDASGDPDFTFGDLARALRLCRIDLGVEIEIDLAPLRPDPKSRRSAQAWAVGTIHYGSGPAGVLLFLKAALTEATPSDVLSFACECAAFPHDSTANQWFTEQQFESYRLLGQCVALAALRSAEGLPLKESAPEPGEREPLRRIGWAEG
jgi:patatin-like phospholipase